MILYRRKFFFRNRTFDHIRRCRMDHRCFILFNKSYTLFCRISSLIKLSRKILYRKAVIRIGHIKCLFIKNIYRRFCKYPLTCLFKSFIWNIFHIISNQHTHSRHICNTEIMADFMTQLLRSNSKLRLLLYKYTFHITHMLSPPFLTENLCLYRTTLHIISIINITKLSNKQY